MEDFPVRQRSKARWLLLAASLAVVAGLGWYVASWYPAWRAWSNRGFAPLFVDIEPADGAIIRGVEAWVRWSPMAPAKGRVMWREAGGFRIRTANAGEGQQLLSRVAPLKDGKKYEYIVVQEAEGTILRSSVRTFSVRAGLAFEPERVEQTVQRDYDQTVALTLRNSSREKIRIASKALTQFADLPADIVGWGSADDPVEIAAGEKLSLRLAVTAADATHDSYEIPVEAGGAYAMAHVRVPQPKLKLSLNVISEDPNTLSKTVELRNEGDAITDLAIHVATPNQKDVALQPSAEHARLEAGASLRFAASPVLYLEFQSLKADIEAKAAGQSVRFPLEFQAPPGKRLIGIRSGSILSSLGFGWYCTNKPNTCGNLPGPTGAIGGAVTSFMASGLAAAFNSSVPGGLAAAQERVRLRMAVDTDRYDGIPYCSDGDCGKNLKGTDPHADCSGLVSQAFRDEGLPDPADLGAGGGCERMWNNLPIDLTPHKGDVVFFHSVDGAPHHCGVVLLASGDGKLIRWRHATGHGVKQNSPNDPSGWDQDKQGPHPYGDYIMGYRRPQLFPTLGPCVPPPAPEQCAY